MLDHGKDYNLSPRYHQCSNTLFYKKDGDHDYVFSGSGCLLLIDTQQEEKIGLGQNYPFEALGEGECIIPGSM